MAEQKESSVLFSLKELMSLEEDRIQQEENARKQAENAAEQSRASEERRQREAEESRMQAAEEKRRVDEQRSREEQARIEGIRHAEVEKARVDAENRARMEQITRQQQHEKELVALTQDKSKKNLKVLVGLAIAAVIAVGAGAGIYIKGSMEKEAKLNAMLAELGAKEEANAKKERDLKEELGKATDPTKQAEIAKRIADLEALNLQLQAQRENAAKSGSGGKPVSGGVAAPATQAPHKPQCHMMNGTKVPSCQPGDAMCSCD